MSMEVGLEGNGASFSLVRKMENTYYKNIRLFILFQILMRKVIPS